MSDITMSTEPRANLFLNKTRIQQIIVEENRALQFVPDMNATPQNAREMIIASGINPEDNLGSCGIISARDEK